MKPNPTNSREDSRLFAPAELLKIGVGAVGLAFVILAGFVSAWWWLGLNPGVARLISIFVLSGVVAWTFWYGLRAGK